MATLCLAILRALKNLWLHTSSKCGHVSLSLFWYERAFNIRKLMGLNMLFLRFFIYWTNLYFNICVT